jgi:hypothetical protein
MSLVAHRDAFLRRIRPIFATDRRMGDGHLAGSTDAARSGVAMKHVAARAASSWSTFTRRRGLEKIPEAWHTGARVAMRLE